MNDSRIQPNGKESRIVNEKLPHLCLRRLCVPYQRSHSDRDSAARNAVQGPKMPSQSHEHRDNATWTPCTGVQMKKGPDWGVVSTKLLLRLIPCEAVLRFVIVAKPQAN